MFKNLFSKQEKKEEFFEPVDPVVERRRQEKFSAPLIYDEEFNEKQIEEKKPKIKTIQVDDLPKPKSTYKMSEIISPMFGSSEKKSDKNETTKKTTVRTKRKKADQLVPVISPFYGMNDTEEVDEVVVVEEAINVKVESPKKEVEDNLRNIAKIIEEEKDQLRIIEERTGEFKLDFSNVATEDDKVSLIDEIEDDMSLDELMSLYEKKFTD